MARTCNAADRPKAWSSGRAGLVQRGPHVQRANARPPRHGCGCGTHCIESHTCGRGEFGSTRAPCDTRHNGTFFRDNVAKQRAWLLTIAQCVLLQWLLQKHAWYGLVAMRKNWMVRFQFSLPSNAALPLSRQSRVRRLLAADRLHALSVVAQRLAAACKPAIV
jgi:hypothetical protein